MSPPVGVVAAMPLEARILGVADWRPGEVLEGTGGVRVACSGIGPRRASLASRALAESGVGGLLSWGVAGGLDPDLAAGTLLLPERVVTDDQLWTCDPDWRRRLAEALRPELAPHAGAVLGSERVVADPAHKAERFRSTGAVAADMESAAVAASAREAGIPFLVLRAVSDPAGSALPHAGMVAVDEAGRPRYGPMLRSLLRRPGQLGKLFALRRDTRAAVAALSAALSRVGPGFASTSLDAWE